MATPADPNTYTKTFVVNDRGERFEFQAFDGIGIDGSTSNIVSGDELKYFCLELKRLGRDDFSPLKYLVQIQGPDGELQTLFEHKDLDEHIYAYAEGVDARGRTVVLTLRRDTTLKELILHGLRKSNTVENCARRLEEAAASGVKDYFEQTVKFYLRNKDLVDEAKAWRQVKDENLHSKILECIQKQSKIEQDEKMKYFAI